MKKEKLKKQILKDISEFTLGVAVAFLIITPGNIKTLHCEACGKSYKYNNYIECDKMCKKCFDYYQCIGEKNHGYLYEFKDGTGYYFE